MGFAVFSFDEEWLIPGYRGFVYLNVENWGQPSTRAGEGWVERRHREPSGWAVSQGQGDVFPAELSRFSPSLRSAGWPAFASAL